MLWQNEMGSFFMTVHTLSELLAKPTLSIVDGSELKIDDSTEDGHGFRLWLSGDDEEGWVASMERRDPNAHLPGAPGHATWYGCGRWEDIGSYTPEDDRSDTNEQE